MTITHQRQILSSLLRQVSFYAKAGDVNTTPPIGPMLSQHGIDVKLFCNMFNTETKNYDKGFLLKVVLNIYKNNTFSYIIKSSPLFFLFELTAEIFEIQYNYRKLKGISLYNIYLITLIKNIEYNLINIKFIFKLILKEAKRYGYKIIENKKDNQYYIYI
jgi:large subunit ribosomal protein L11